MKFASKVKKMVDAAGRAASGQEDQDRSERASLLEENLRLHAALSRLETRLGEMEVQARRDVGDELATWKRKALDYFGLIESLEKQRDVWKEMWKTQASGHLNAQAMLETTIEGLRHEISTVVKILNKYRAEKGEPAMKGPVWSTAGAISRIYAEKLKIAWDAAPADIDGRKARDRIAEAP